MINKDNKRFVLTLKKSDFEYLETICKIYNDELLKEKDRLINKKYKLSVSALYQIAIGNLIMNIDNQLDTKKSREFNHKKIYLFLCTKK